MNYSKNTKKKNKIFRRIFASWVITFLVGVVFGIIISAACTTPNRVSAVNDEVITVANATESEVINLGEYKLTAYCSCKKCCGKSDGITASGVKAKQGVTIAADTNLLPFGTVVLIDGHEYIVQDKGGSIKGNRIDMYFDDHNEAIKFGVQYKDIYKKEGVKND